MNLSTRLREARIEANMTQQELAKRAGVATGTIQQYESGKRQPRIAQLQAIAKVLGTSWLELSGEDSLELTVGKSAAKEIKAAATAEDAVLDLLSSLYESVDIRSVNAGSANQIYYYVSGKDGSFALFDRDIATLCKSILNMLPPLIDRMKDTRSESEIIESAIADINSAGTQAALEKARKRHMKRFPGSYLNNK